MAYAPEAGIRLGHDLFHLPPLKDVNPQCRMQIASQVQKILAKHNDGDRNRAFLWQHATTGGVAFLMNRQVHSLRSRID
jgi:hypothetical protein